MLLDRQNPAGTAAKRPAGLRLQPASLTGSVLYSSPLSARSLSLSGRGKLADRGTVYTSKVRAERLPVASASDKTILCCS